MSIIYVTGNIGTGKSFICNKISNLFGFIKIDADLIIHQLYTHERIKKKLKKVFNTDNRSEISKIVFKSQEKLCKLDEIFLPEFILVHDELIKKYKNVVFEIPLLFEKNLNHSYKPIILTICDFNTQLNRVMKRDKLTEEEALLRINSQLSVKDKIPLSDYIVNTGKEYDLLQQLIKIHKSICILKS